MYNRLPRASASFIVYSVRKSLFTVGTRKMSIFRLNPACSPNELSRLSCHKRKNIGSDPAGHLICTNQPARALRRWTLFTFAPVIPFFPRWRSMSGGGSRACCPAWLALLPASGARGWPAVSGGVRLSPVVLALQRETRSYA